MKNDSRKYRDEFFYVMNAMADSVVSMSDKEIEDEMNEDGDNTEEIHGVLLNAIKLGRQHALHDAREQYEANLSTFRQTEYALPSAPHEKRSLIESMLGSMAQAQQPLTAQFRDFENMPDEDLDAVLAQLFALQSLDKEEE